MPLPRKRDRNGFYAEACPSFANPNARRRREGDRLASGFCALLAGVCQASPMRLGEAAAIFLNGFPIEAPFFAGPLFRDIHLALRDPRRSELGVEPLLARDAL